MWGLGSRVGLREAQDRVALPESETRSACQVGRSRAHDGDADAARAGQFACDDSRHSRGGLVLNEDEGNVDRSTGLYQVYRASSAGDAEDTGHSAVLQGLGKGVAYCGVR